MNINHITTFFLFVALLFQSCATSYKYSYEEENAPLFVGDYIDRKLICAPGDNPSIKVVSFNIEFSQNIDEAIELLKQEPLVDADVILLQEMDETGTDSIAKCLNMSYVYYPAIFHPKHGQNVGNAVLSKWKISESSKIKLPHPSSYPAPMKAKSYVFRKTATVAEIEIYGDLIVFASTHAAAFNTTVKKREFAKALASEIQDSEVAYAVVGGDFNSMGRADIDATVSPFISSSFLWASQFLGMTISTKKPILNFFPTEAFQLDHLFVKGMCINEMGKVNQIGVSDHLPIWAEMEIKEKYITKSGE
ncbi:MAG: endonuclease/exonuclease/phosphatase family metal-dependent hydrolase [Saprospiraceae bacterium]